MGELYLASLDLPETAIILSEQPFGCGKSGSQKAAPAFPVVRHPYQRRRKGSAMSRRNLAWLLGIIAVAVLGFAVSYSAPPRERDRDYELVRLMVDVLNEVDHKYVNDLDPDHKRKLVEDMINGGLERLDPHSAYINPKNTSNSPNRAKASSAASASR